MPRTLNSFSAHPALFCLFALLAFPAACNRGASQAPAKRYPFKGKVIAVDKQTGTASISNEPIPGFMDAMIMPYSIHPPAALDQLHPSDSITADVVVAPDKYWLENVKIAGHEKPAAGKPSASLERVREKKEEIVVVVLFENLAILSDLASSRRPRFLQRDEGSPPAHSRSGQTLPPPKLLID